MKIRHRELEILFIKGYRHIQEDTSEPLGENSLILIGFDILTELSLKLMGILQQVLQGAELLEELLGGFLPYPR